MAISPSLPYQRTGSRGRIDTCVFRITWSAVALVVTPLLVVTVIATLKLLPKGR